MTDHRAGVSVLTTQKAAKLDSLTRTAAEAVSVALVVWLQHHEGPQKAEVRLAET